jgi:hypothetical protein
MKSPKIFPLNFHLTASKTNTLNFLQAQVSLSNKVVWLHFQGKRVIL